jgi:hypothetical protein
MEGIIVFEIDEDGKEGFGYSFSSEETDHADVISTFAGNVQYLVSVTFWPSGRWGDSCD